MVYGPPDGPRRTRWGPPDAKVFIPGVPPLIPNNLGAEEMDALLIRVRMEEITLKLTSGRIDVDRSDTRSQSPPPKYDSFGKRVNTRDVRTRENMQQERHSLIQFAHKMSNSFRPPMDYRPGSIRRELKLYIPVDKYPGYNFIGLILGPRGITQKQMERESGAKVALRGKGSVKDGRGRLGANYNEEEPLHVLLTADNDESLEKAEAMVKKLLVPVEENKNEHKRQQLRKLAEFNGTLRDNMWDGGEDRRDMFSDTGVVQCLNCGERSHPTRDCPVKNRRGKGQQEPSKSLDNEVASFFSELDDSAAGVSTKTLEELDCSEYREAFEELLKISEDPYMVIPGFEPIAMGPPPGFHPGMQGQGPPGMPPMGMQQQWAPQPGYPQQGFPQQGYPQQGYPPQGFPQQGYPQQGFPGQPAPYGAPPMQ